MKLHTARPSPFVRKVLVLAIETGLSDRIERMERAVSPVSPDADVTRDNPIGKIPALVTEDGTTLYDSRVICEFLDSLHLGNKMFPKPGPERWTALRQQALADGILDAAVLTRYETALRPSDHRWQGWVAAQKEKVTRGLDALEREAPRLGDDLTIGLIAIGCALGYLDFRFADDNWRDGRPNLTAWSNSFAHRDSMLETAPA